MVSMRKDCCVLEFVEEGIRFKAVCHVAVQQAQGSVDKKVLRQRLLEAFKGHSGGAVGFLDVRLHICDLVLEVA